MDLTDVAILAGKQPACHRRSRPSRSRERRIGKVWTRDKALVARKLRLIAVETASTLAPATLSCGYALPREDMACGSRRSRAASSGHMNLLEVVLPETSSSAASPFKSGRQALL